MNAPVMAIAELADRNPTRSTLELLGLARRLAGRAHAIAALFTDEADKAPQELIAHGADQVGVVQHEALGAYHSEAWVTAAAEVCREVRPSLVIACHSAIGADLAPRLAFRLDTAVATGCVDITREQEKFLFTRSCHGGNAREVISFRSAPVIATVRPGYHEALPRNGDRGGELISMAPDLSGAAKRVRIIERRPDAEDRARLENARVVVAGGRGLGGPDGFRTLEQLAQVLGGAVGASRVPCDLGWCPRSWQIGLTGRTVQPDLYIAVGISGAGHHMAGCGRAKTIVAVNTDPDAAIFKEARWGIVGDYHQIVPALLDEVRKRRRAA